MKLRNKKTGEIGDFAFVRANSTVDDTTLTKLNEEWEDCTPTEPLIKDEKIRKAVRAWAEVNMVTDVLYDKDKDLIYSGYGPDDTDTSVCISFDDLYVFENLESRKLYAIAELCGEEE